MYLPTQRKRTPFRTLYVMVDTVKGSEPFHAPPTITRLGKFFHHYGVFARKWPLPLCVYSVVIPFPSMLLLMSNEGPTGEKFPRVANFHLFADSSALQITPRVHCYQHTELQNKKTRRTVYAFFILILIWLLSLHICLFQQAFSDTLLEKSTLMKAFYM